MRWVVQEAVCRLLAVTGLLARRRRSTAGAARILMYHGIGEGGNRNEVHPRALTRQLRALKESCDIHPLDDLVDLLEAGGPSRDQPPPAAITFDDGLRGVLDAALPVLAELQVPATVFVVTDLLETGGPVWTGEVNALVAALPPGRHELPGGDLVLPGGTSQVREAAAAALKSRLKRLPPAERTALLDVLRERVGPCRIPAAERTLDWEAADRLSATGLVRLGSHTATHPILPLCRDEDLEREVARSREVLLARWPDRVSQVFCYPNGDRDPRVVEAVRRAGYRAAVTTRPGLYRPRQDAYKMPRIGVYRDTGFATFSAKLAGWGETAS